MSSEKVKWSGFLMQALATLVISNLVTLTGFIYAWPSYTIEMFRSNATILTSPMTTLEVSLFGSLTNIGALVMTPFCGFAVDKLGRKYAAMLFGLPYAVTWAVLYFATSTYVILAMTLLAGVGAAGQAVSSVYISEISQDAIRGAMTSSTVANFFVGLLFSYILGGYLTYHQVICVHLSLSVAYMLFLVLLKESPVFLLKIGKEEEAAKSISFYRRVSVTSKEVEVEIKKIKLQLDPRIDKILQGDNELPDQDTTKALMDTPPETVQSPWQFLKNSESSKRALVVVVMVMSLAILMGSIVLQVYAEPLFKEAVPSMHPNLCSIILATVYLAASLCFSVMVDKFGRKPLMVYTSIASGVCNAFLGSQLHLRWAPHWFTAFVIYAYSFVYNLGIAVVPFVLTAEVFLPEVRGLCNSISMAAMWIVNFITLIIFNPLVELIGLGPVFYLFSVVCFIGAIYGQFWVPETKGLSADAIQILFINKGKVNTNKAPKV